MNMGMARLSRDFCREIKSTVVYLCSIRVCRGGRGSGKCGRVGRGRGSGKGIHVRRGRGSGK